MDVSIILINYKKSRMTADAVVSVKEKTSGVTYEIIVVDNDSKDDIEAVMSELPYVKLIMSPVNLGFGKANNLGRKSATGKYLFFLNNDTLLRNNAVKILFDYMESHPEVGLCGGNIFDANGNPAQSYSVYLPCIEECIAQGYPYPIRQRILRKYGLSDEKFNTSGSPKEVASTHGADFFIPSTLYDDLGGFDPEFFMYYEEGEFAHRISAAGYKIMNVPDAEITHFEGASFSGGKFNAFQYRCGKASQFLYYEKVYGKEYPEKIYKLRLRQLRLLRLKPNSHANEKIRILKEEYAKYLERTRG